MNRRQFSSLLALTTAALVTRTIPQPRQLPAGTPRNYTVVIKTTLNSASFNPASVDTFLNKRKAAYLMLAHTTLIEPVTRALPHNLTAEPTYPDADHLVTFSIRYPNLVSHRKHEDCPEETPHDISECGMFEHTGKCCEGKHSTL